ncbi:MAG: hypothetical protein P8123_08930, partial [bacterium]
MNFFSLILSSLQRIPACLTKLRQERSLAEGEGLFAALTLRAQSPLPGRLIIHSLLPRKRPRGGDDSLRSPFGLSHPFG